RTLGLRILFNQHQRKGFDLAKEEAMKDNLKKPCDECPFRKKSLKGWLGGETPQSTLDFVNGEADFACHKTRHKEESAMSRCKGFLMFTRKMCKIPKYN